MTDEKKDKNLKDRNGHLSYLCSHALPDPKGEPFLWSQAEEDLVKLLLDNPKPKPSQSFHEFQHDIIPLLDQILSKRDLKKDLPQTARFWRAILRHVMGEQKNPFLCATLFDRLQEGQEEQRLHTWHDYAGFGLIQSAPPDLISQTLTPAAHWPVLHEILFNDIHPATPQELSKNLARFIQSAPSNIQKGLADNIHQVIINPSTHPQTLAFSPGQVEKSVVLAQMVWSIIERDVLSKNLGDDLDQSTTRPLKKI